MEVITRKTAKAAGLKHYFTGRPCKNGHVDKRFVSSSRCKTCAREKALQAFRSLHGAKREARRAYEQRRWQDPKVRQRALKYQRERDRETKSKANSEWKKAHRASCTDRQHERMARLRAVFVEAVSLEYLFTRDKGRCQLCGKRLSLKTKWPHPLTPTRDHIVPLTQGGLHERKNLQLACKACNVRKGNRAMQDQLRLIG